MVSAGATHDACQLFLRIPVRRRIPDAPPLHPRRDPRQPPSAVQSRPPHNVAASGIGIAELDPTGWADFMRSTSATPRLTTKAVVAADGTRTHFLVDVHERSESRR